MNLGEVIEQRRDEIVARFTAAVAREDPTRLDPGRVLLADHIPAFLDELAAELSSLGTQHTSRDVADVSSPGRQHGRQRYSLGYDLPSLVREYGLLEHVILDVAKRARARPSLDELDVLTRRLNVGITEAVSEYVAFRDEQLAAESQKELARVEAAARARDEFVAVVSHELRNPVSVILGWARLLRRGTLAPERLNHALEVIERNAATQQQLVENLADIGRVTTGRIRLHPSQVDLSEVVDAAVEEVRLALEAKRITLETELERGKTLLRADGERLLQVVWNLLTNAMKFTPKEGKIKVTLRRVDSDLELTVSDSGVGIAPERLPDIFDTFRQSDVNATRRSGGGLGIGLSITRHLVALHGGSIEAHSDGPGRGATFVVRLPVSPLVSPTVGVGKVPVGAPRPTSTEQRGGIEGLRVLVVDDNEDARELVAFTLESCGAQVHTAASVPEALTELDRFDPDIVISDIGMPEIDGFSLIRSIRSSPNARRAALPVIALTAFSRDEDRERALAEGFTLHVTKPVEPAELVDAVASLAKRKSSEPKP